MAWSMREKVETVIAVAGVVAAGAAAYISLTSAAIAEDKVAPVERRVTEVEKKQAAQEAVLVRIDKTLDEIKLEQRAQREQNEAMLRELVERARRRDRGK